ncbi:hypothetical protein CTEN210_18409 [Chaetoceros tenuissimus]|uniref:RING-type E3 ubiquitin transferase n=1 Tax=Chaetoceros tenuissimus TaxID=426638 RepID=A0AAD3DCL0_9STRA|nr:hypothetical protein CTEN210_18409 [Chaetoceros tenuissimus]
MSSEVVQDCDRELTSDFTYLVLKQYKVCYITDNERTGPFRRGHNKAGYPGIQCRHCNKRQIFSCNAQSLKNNRNLVGHMNSCPDIPHQIKIELEELESSHHQQILDLPFTCMYFYETIFDRLQALSRVDESSASEEAAATGDSSTDSTASDAPDMQESSSSTLLTPSTPTIQSEDLIQKEAVGKESTKVNETNKIRDLVKDLECVVCLDIVSNPHIVPDCCHRFCKDCIEEAIHRFKSCPLCMSHISSKRHLRKDVVMGKVADYVRGVLEEGKDISLLQRCEVMQSEIEHFQNAQTLLKTEYEKEIADLKLHFDERMRVVRKENRGQSKTISKLLKKQKESTGLDIIQNQWNEYQKQDYNEMSDFQRFKKQEFENTLIKHKRITSNESRKRKIRE